MARQHIYTVFSNPDMNSWRVAKMDRDWHIEETYIVTKVSWEIPGTLPKEIRLCTCFAGSKDTCRHRQMVTIFEEEKCIDSRRAYNFDQAKWIDPPKATLELL